MFKLVLAYADVMLMSVSTDGAIKTISSMLEAYVLKQLALKKCLRADLCLVGLTNRSR